MSFYCAQKAVFSAAQLFVSCGSTHVRIFIAKTYVSSLSYLATRQMAIKFPFCPAIYLTAQKFSIPGTAVSHRTDHDLNNLDHLIAQIHCCSTVGVSLAFSMALRHCTP